MEKGHIIHMDIHTVVIPEQLNEKTVFFSTDLPLHLCQKNNHLCMCGLISGPSVLFR